MGQAREILDQMTKAFVSGDLDTVRRLYATDAVAETPEGQLKGADAIVGWLKQFNDALPDVRYSSVHNYECGDTAVDEGHVVGTNTGPLALPSGETIPATGKTVKLASCDLATVQNGVITSHRFYYDNLELLSQLGLNA